MESAFVSPRPDIAHLIFQPPDGPGSVNRLVAQQLAGLKQLSQIAVCYGDTNGQPSGADTNIVRVTAEDLGWVQRQFLKLPHTAKASLYDRIGDSRFLAFLWCAQGVLAASRPRLVICHDHYKLGVPLRRKIDWPCRLILGQHGLSYQLPVALHGRLYSYGVFDAVIVLTRASYQYDRQQTSAYEPIVAVIPNGVDHRTFRPADEATKLALRKEYRIPPGALVVACTGRLVPKKGVHVVLRGWREIRERVPNAFLWVIGDGEQKYRTSLQAMIRNLGIANSVRIHGYVAPQDMPGCYQAADLYVLPTLASEGMGLTVLEAMSSGLACVVSDYASGRELFHSSELVFVTDPNVEGAFVEPLLRILENEQQRRDFGRSARLAVEKRFTREIWLDRLAHFYQRELELVGK